MATARQGREGEIDSARASASAQRRGGGQRGLMANNFGGTSVDARAAARDGWMLRGSRRTCIFVARGALAARVRVLASALLVLRAALRGVTCMSSQWASTGEKGAICIILRSAAVVVNERMRGISPRFTLTADDGVSTVKSVALLSCRSGPLNSAEPIDTDAGRVPLIPACGAALSDVCDRGDMTATRLRSGTAVSGRGTTS